VGVEAQAECRLQINRSFEFSTGDATVAYEWHHDALRDLYAMDGYWVTW
jgi:hypothetical protein